MCQLLLINKASVTKFQNNFGIGEKVIKCLFKIQNVQSRAKYIRELKGVQEMALCGFVVYLTSHIHSPLEEVLSHILSWRRQPRRARYCQIPLTELIIIYLMFYFHASIRVFVYLLVHDYLCVLSVERTFPASLFSAHPVNYLVIFFYRGGISKLDLSQSNSNLLIYLSIY